MRWLVFSGFPHMGMLPFMDSFWMESINTIIPQSKWMIWEVPLLLLRNLHMNLTYVYRRVRRYVARKLPDACATSRESWRPTSWYRRLNHGGFHPPIQWWMEGAMKAKYWGIQKFLRNILYKKWGPVWGYLDFPNHKRARPWWCLYWFIWK